MHKAVYSKLNQAGVRYFQLTHAVEFISYLYIMQITSEEIHNSVILMKQISLHICIIHFVTKDLAANAVTSKTDALGCHHWHPALSVFAKQKHSSNSQCTIGADKSQVAKYLLTVMPPCYRRAYRIKRCFIKSVTSQAFLLQHSLKTVAKKQFDSHCIKVVDSCVPNTGFVRSKTAAVCHHFCEFGIVENLTLVCSILHPYNSFIIMIWLVKL